MLVHGIGMSHRYLDRLQQALGAAGPVHAIDLPGFGGLPKPGHDVDVPAMGWALAEVIASLNSGPVILLGHSMGAQWVVEAALHRPDLVARLAIMGPVADNAHRTLPAQMSALILDTLREPPLANAIVFIDYIRCGIPWYLVQVRHMLSYPIEQRVPLLPMPLLVIRGGRDPIAGLAWCRALRDAAPDGALVEIPRRHHVAQHGAARAVASALSAFIEGRIGSQEAVR
ncbi:alpha/beta hydrolase [Planococcus sp. APC 4015]|nr:alpha/beta hydrolase [Planococcus sp. APC 4015]